MAEGKKHKATSETVRPENVSVGGMLQAARIAKNLKIEDVSSVIHIRSVQLRAIEEGNIDALPGMTYAVGFVRSYATFLGLNSAEVVHKFKAEHGHAPAQTKLVFPEPVPESRMPNPMMVGVGGFLAILLLIVWTVYSNMNDGSNRVVEQIPPAPEVTTTAEMTPPETAVVAVQETSPSVVIPLAAPAPVAAETSKPAMPAEQLSSTMPSETPAAAVAAEGSVAISTAAPEKTLSEGKTEEPLAKVEAPKAEESKEPVITIKRGTGRIVLKATQASWVQITNTNQDVIYRKVLRQGEQYAVPDQTGLTLVTANAGGLDIEVDGQPVQSIGKSGEIVRGIALDPVALKKHRIKVRN